MREKPWEGLVCVKTSNPNAKREWNMINEGRSDAVKLVKDICQWITADVDLNNTEVSELKEKWKKIGNLKSDQEAEECFEYLIELRTQLSE